MNIVVCIKQVPDTNEVKINPETNTLIRSGVPSIINPFDENAIEEGLRLKDKNGGKVTVVSMGPPQVETALRDALALGVDDVILVTDRAFAGADTLATSYTLGRTIEKFVPDYDIIIFGKQAIDGDTAQVGPGVAEYLGIPEMIYVVNIEKTENNTISLKRELEDGFEVAQSKLPAVITVLKSINTPRYPSLKGKMKAKTAVIKTVSAKDIEADENRIGLKGSPTWVSRIFTPPPKGNSQIITDEDGNSAVFIKNKLKELTII
ncbi:MAG: electron transfer flavoprotein subunit beta/FixA family protein [Candidatus Margulisbacteria bacterium]|nr:electron transfer flavoprotein subunit beta/FixA family protein [Candidatus Margulisiibacteriota bacterium]